jgi:hypothetical protein
MVAPGVRGETSPMNRGPVQPGTRPGAAPEWMWPALLFAAALAATWTGLWLHTGEPFPQSKWPYFVYYARALLDGHLYFTVAPPALLDLSRYQGQLYMHLPPFPAVLFAPLVALGGLGLPDRFLSVLIGASNGAAFYLLLAALDRRRILPVPPPARLFLSLFFVFGTVHLYLSTTGNPWELAHVVCNALVIWALWLTLRRHVVLAALCYVAVLFTRTHVFLTAPAIVALYWIGEGREGRDAGARVRGLAPVAGVWAAGVALLLAFNAARFGNPFENGISYHLMHETFRARYARTGYFDLAYVPRNLQALLLALPVFRARPPLLTVSPHGLSLFLASPLYVYLLRSVRAPQRALALVLWGGVALAAVPILMLMGTGELQFGHRYSSDLQVFLILLTYLGMGLRITRTALVLLAASIAMNVLGAWWFVSGYAQ